MPVSRTKRTLQNSKVSLILFVIQILIGFYSRKIFLEYLGDEVLGLNTTIGNILSFLNLAELGIGIAMATSLYRPLYKNDQDTIIEIISMQGILYRRIAILLCMLSIPVLIAIPFVFPSVECGILYVYIAYFVFLSGSIFSYLWNYRQILIGADQKNFKLIPWTNAVRLSKIFLQIALLLYTPFGIWGWIGIEFVGNIVNVFVTNFIIKKEYPWLHKSSASAEVLLTKYRHLLTKTKQLFIHKIAGFVLYQTSPLIIYAFVSINMVTYYSNYMILIGYCTSLMNVVYSGMGASIGNLIAENDKKHTMSVFEELFTSRIWIGGIACFCLYTSIEPFITFWIGSKYILSETTLLLLIIYMFIQISRSVIESFKDAYQLFADVWSPIAESIINLGGSILFGYLWGLNGVLIGVNLSLFLIVLIWKPYYTFKHGMKVPPLYYYIQYALHLCILIVSAIFTKFIISFINYDKTDIFMLISVILLGIIIYVTITYMLMMIFTEGMRKFTNRIRIIISNKI